MKFFIFNLLVVGAISFLVLRNNGGPDVSGLVGKDPASIADVTNTVEAPSLQPERSQKKPLSAEDIRTLVQEHMLNLSPTVSDTSIVTPKTPIETATTRNAPSQTPVAKVVTERRVHVPPQVSPALEIKTKASAAREEDQPFMTPRERQRELTKLVRDMELLFADKLSD